MVFVHLRDTSSLRRTRLDDIDIGNTVEVFKKESEKRTGIPSSQQRLIYLGRILEEGKTLSSYGVSEGSTIYVLKRPPPCQHPNTADPLKPPPTNSVGKPAPLIELLEKVAKNPAYQSSVKRILQDPDARLQLMSATPDLKNDPVAVALVKDPELLKLIAETADVERIASEHPALVQLASHLMALISEERTTERHINPSNSTGMSDVSNMEGIDPGLVARAEMIAAQEEGMQDRQATRPQQISAMQLALALSQAGVTSQPSSSAASPLQPRAGLSQPPFQPPSTAITSDFFSQAMASAIASTTQQQQPRNDNAHPHQAALQQMRAVGIMNDDISLQALIQTGGDVQAALNFLLGDGDEPQ